MLILGIITVGQTAEQREHALMFLPIMLGLIAIGFALKYTYEWLRGKHEQ